MALTPEQVQAFKDSYSKKQKKDKSGYVPPSQVMASRAVRQDLEEKEGFVSRVKMALGERFGEVKETFEETARGEISPVEFAVRNVGDVVAVAGDIAGAAAQPLIEDLAQSRTGRPIFEALAKGVDFYEEVKNTNEATRRVGEVLESFVNIADIVGATGAVKGAGRAATKVGAKVGRAAGDLAGEVAERVPAGAGRVLSEIIGATTGVGEEAFVEAFNNPNVIKFARQAGKEGPGALIEDALVDAERGVRNILKTRGENYAKQLKNLDTDLDMSNLLEDLNIKVNTLRPDLESIVEGENVIKKAISDIEEWDNPTLGGMDALKRRLDSYENQLSAPGKAPAKRIVGELHEFVNRQLLDNVNGYRELVQPYAEASELLKDIKTSLSITGDVQRQETAARKLIQTMRRDQDLRKNLIQQLEVASGSDISAKLAGSMLGDVLPQGIGRRFAAPGALFAAFNPSFIGAMLPFIPLMSPRVMAEVTSLAGKITKSMITKNKFPKKLLPDLERLYKAIEETASVGAGAGIAGGVEEVITD